MIDILMALLLSWLSAHDLCGDVCQPPPAAPEAVLVMVYIEEPQYFYDIQVLDQQGNRIPAGVWLFWPEEQPSDTPKAPARVYKDVR